MTTPSLEGLALGVLCRTARQVSAVPTLEDLCYISGRDPRIWLRPEVYEDLIASILASLAAAPDSTVVEVGCASGFLACGIAPRVGRYVGVDLATSALAVAKRLPLSNAEFARVTGTASRFATIVTMRRSVMTCSRSFRSFRTARASSPRCCGS